MIGRSYGSTGTCGRIVMHYFRIMTLSCFLLVGCQTSNIDNDQEVVEAQSQVDFGVIISDVKYGIDYRKSGDGFTSSDPLYWVWTQGSKNQLHWSSFYTLSDFSFTVREDSFGRRVISWKAVPTVGRAAKRKGSERVSLELSFIDERGRTVETVSLLKKFPKKCSLLQGEVAITSDPRRYVRSMVIRTSGDSFFDVKSTACPGLPRAEPLPSGLP